MWFMILTTSSLTLEDTLGCSSVKVFTASTKYLPDVRWLGQQNVFCRNENVLQLGKCLERFSWNKALWSPSFFLMLFSFATMSKFHWNLTVSWIYAFQGRVCGDPLHPPEPDPVRVGGCGDATRLRGSQESCNMRWNGRRTFLLWGRDIQIWHPHWRLGSWKASRFCVKQY